MRKETIINSNLKHTFRMTNRIVCKVKFMQYRKRGNFASASQFNLIIFFLNIITITDVAVIVVIR